MNYTWERFGGYELSSKGDKRFSAFYARMPDGRTLEQHYQCDVKGYDPGGINWKLGKGRPPLRDVDLWEEYLSLWRIWAEEHHEELADLYITTSNGSRILSDRFATTPINQARAVATLLNEHYVK